LIVAAAIASAGDIFMCVHARDRTNGMLGVGEEPGLKSVARAIATPESISFRAAGISAGRENGLRRGRELRSWHA